MLQDLDAYICLREDCPTPDILYSHSADWLDHIRQTHLLRWRCPIPVHTPPCILESKNQMIQHMKEDHSGFLTDDQLVTFASRTGVPIGTYFESCPLCGIHNTERNLEHHVAEHLRFLALKCLPWTEDAGASEVKSSNSSATLRTTIMEDVDDWSSSIFDSNEIPQWPEAAEDIQDVPNGMTSANNIRNLEWGFLPHLEPTYDGHEFDFVLQCLISASRDQQQAPSSPPQLNLDSSSALRIATALQLSNTIAGYLETIDYALGDHDKLSEGIRSAINSLDTLSKRTEHEKGATTVKMLSVAQGPLETYIAELERLSHRLAPPRAHKRARMALASTDLEVEVRAVLAAIEALNSIFTIAIPKDHT